MDTDNVAIQLDDGIKAVAHTDTVLITYDSDNARMLTEEELTCLATIYKTFCGMDPDEFKGAVNNG